MKLRTQWIQLNYDPLTGNWLITGKMHDNRSSHTATILTNGKVLVAGGGNDG